MAGTKWLWYEMTIIRENYRYRNQNGPLPKRPIEIKNVNFLNRYDILCIISMILYVFNYMY